MVVLSNNLGRKFIFDSFQLKSNSGHTQHSRDDNHIPEFLFSPKSRLRVFKMFQLKYSLLVFLVTVVVSSFPEKNGNITLYCF